MPEEPVIIAYFKNLFSDPSQSLMGKMEDPDFQIEGKLCSREGKKDQVFLYGRMKDEKIAGLKFMCALCDPHMFVAADILCRLAVGKGKAQIASLDEDEFRKLLGGSSQEGLEHFKRARELLLKAMRRGKQS